MNWLRFIDVSYQVFPSPRTGHEFWGGGVELFPYRAVWIVFPPNLYPPRPQNMTLFWNRMFADMIKIRLYWIKVGPKCNDCCPYKERRGQIHRRKKAIWWEKSRLKWCSYNPRNTKDCWKPAEVKKRQGRILPKGLQGEHGPANT